MDVIWSIENSIFISCTYIHDMYPGMMCRLKSDNRIVMPFSCIYLLSSPPLGQEQVINGKGKRTCCVEKMTETWRNELQ
jgi:hypothetical protein